MPMWWFWTWAIFRERDWTWELELDDFGNIGRGCSDPKALRSSASLWSITLVGFSPDPLDIWTTLPKAPSRLRNHLLIKPSAKTCLKVLSLYLLDLNLTHPVFLICLVWGWQPSPSSYWWKWKPLHITIKVITEHPQIPASSFLSSRCGHLHNHQLWFPATSITSCQSSLVARWPLHAQRGHHQPTSSHFHLFSPFLPPLGWPWHSCHLFSPFLSPLGRRVGLLPPSQCLLPGSSFAKGFPGLMK